MTISKELSIAMIKMERDNATTAPECIQNMLEIVEQAIIDEKVSYDEFVTALAEYFMELVPDDTSSEEERSEAIENICNKVIEKYKSTPDGLLNKLDKRIEEKIEVCNKILDEIEHGTEI